METHLAATVVLPAVERAAERLADDAAALAEVRAEVRAVRVEHVHPPLARAEHHEVPAEVVRALHLARDEVPAPRDGEPPVGDRELDAAGAVRGHDFPPPGRAAERVAEEARGGERAPTERIADVVGPAEHQRVEAPEHQLGLRLDRMVVEHVARPAAVAHDGGERRV
jgi:hypothetical protein